MSSKQPTVKIFIFAVLIITSIIIIRITGLDDYLDKDKLQTYVKGFGMWGPLLYILIFSIAPSFFLPGLPITIAGGLAFGPIYGTIYTIIGATIGASIAFLVARYFARGFVERLFREQPLLQTIDKGIEKKGWLFVAITRLIPIFPFNLLNYAFGLTKIKFSHYVIASFFCMLPATAAYVVFSSSIFDILKGNISVELIIGIVLIAAVSIIPVIYKKRKGL
ncbi:MAG: TVP38/TMEM64 family protein [Deltaproteobacteria bacterium]|nr:TVP38/TMEM64 family protein [Deltaproteobacteria bacterium]